MKYAIFRIAFVAALFSASVVEAAQLKVCVKRNLAGNVTQLSEAVVEDQSVYTTSSAASVSGYIFTGWITDASLTLVSRDILGRSLDSVSCKIYEDTSLIANYVRSSLDADNDGVADGYELYWYGSLQFAADYDGDADGYTFKEEMANGTNPIFSDDYQSGDIFYSDGVLLQYNPNAMHAYVIRSEPEGKLFATKTDTVKVGTLLPVPSLGSGAYWTVDGAQQRDIFGRALDSLNVRMPNHPIEIVAHTAVNTNERNKLYWYGTTDIDDTLDSDNDGYTFAEEMANGTNPFFVDDYQSGDIFFAEGELLQYNPNVMYAYIIRSEPEGKLFATKTDTVKVGTVLPVPSLGSGAYWTVNGVQQRDIFGRALDVITIRMPNGPVEIVAHTVATTNERNKLYWYGTAEIDDTLDSDNDGYTFAEEMANGSNPFFADDYQSGDIFFSDGNLLEVNLQPYEQAQGAVVDDAYESLFASNWTKNESIDFGSAVRPVVVDLNEDGQFDIVVIIADGRKIVYLNIGSEGNPQFKTVGWESEWQTKVDASILTNIDGLALDMPVDNGLSYALIDVDLDGVEDLLASDSDGRIWFYKGFKEGDDIRYVLQHKVWGGSHAGFATGLTIAAVDWDDDGDIDLICGTSDGKLMLLTDPRSGRPTNVYAEAGATSVVLKWNLNTNSRVRGYGIYRGATQENFDKIQNLWPLTQYRDQPNELKDYYYRVTGKSRFYTAGNSTPVESESMPTDAVFVRFTPELWLNDTSSFTDENVEMIVSINNSSGIAADGLKLTFGYDAEVLEPISISTTGLTKGASFTEDTTTEGVWSISAASGTIGAGSGRFIVLKFHVKKVKGVSNTEVVLRSIAAKSVLGHTINFNLPKVGNIEVYEKEEPPAPVPAGVVMNVADSHANTLSEFSVPIRVTSTKTLKTLSAKVNYDSKIFDFVSSSGCDFSNGIITVNGDVPDVIYLTFFAKDQHAIAESKVILSNVSAKCVDNLSATITVTSGVVYINDTNVPVAPVVTAGLYHVKVMSGDEFSVPLGLTSVGNLAEVAIEIEWDTELITYSGSSTLTFKCAGEYNQLSITGFKMAAIEGLQATSWVKIKSISAVGENGLPATIKAINPETAQVIVSRTIGKYGPGDLDGDGKLTDTDTIILAGYSAYLKSPNALTKNALVKSYQNQYHVNIALTGSAAKAADVNCDGKVDVSDISLLAMLVEEAKGIEQ